MMDLGRFMFVKRWKQGVQALDGETGGVVFMRRVLMGEDRNARRGVALLQNLPIHPNVISFVVSGESAPHFYWIVEFSDYDLNFLYQLRPEVLYLTPQEINFDVMGWFMNKLLKGVAHLHSHGVVHCNLKSGNLLLDRANEILRIGGFQHARAFGEEDLYSPVNNANYHYKAPEVLLGGTHYGGAVDIWACGCIFAEFLLGGVFFGQRNSEFNLCRSIFSVLGTHSEEDWVDMGFLPDWHTYPQYPPLDLATILQPEAVPLLLRMLCINPATRSSAEDCLNDPLLLPYRRKNA